MSWHKYTTITIQKPFDLFSNINYANKIKMIPDSIFNHFLFNYFYIPVYKKINEWERTLHIYLDNYIHEININHSSSENAFVILSETLFCIFTVTKIKIVNFFFLYYIILFISRSLSYISHNNNNNLYYRIVHTWHITYIMVLRTLLSRKTVWPSSTVAPKYNRNSPINTRFI